MQKERNAPSPRKSDSLLRIRWKRFCRLKRGYFSFLLLVVSYVLSFFLPFVMSHRALIVGYDGQLYFPAFKSYWHDAFGFGREVTHDSSVFDQLDPDGLPTLGEANYRRLSETFQEGDSNNWVLLPPIPYNATENFLKQEKGEAPYPPSSRHWLGTDNAGRDLLVRLAYGFNLSISFALIVTFVAYVIGITTGAALGFFGGWVDIVGQRFVEIWGAIPFLYTIIIIASIFTPTFSWLAGILAAFSWLGITYYIRGEFYREKGKDYVAAAIATGENNLTIMFRHILPNALTPIITFAPFAIVATILALVSLDFLGYGLQAPTPSWGQMLRDAKEDLTVWHLVVFPLGAIFITLQLIVFIGEAVREAFDPKVFSRLR